MLGQMFMVLLLLLQLLNSICFATTIVSRQVVSNLFDGDTITDATLLDESTRDLYIAGNPPGFSINAFSLYRINSSGTRDYKTQIPFRSGVVFENPTDLELYDAATLALITNGGFSSGGGDCAVSFLDAASGSRVGSSVILNGPDFVENGETKSLITCLKVVVSTVDPTKIYVMATSLMDINTAAYGYSTFRIDVPSRTVDWVDHFLSPDNPDGGSPSDMIEVNDSVNEYLLVGGFVGLYQYELTTGARTEILPNTRVNNLLLVQNTDLIIVGAAGSDASVALTASTLASQWTMPNGRGIVFHQPPPNDNDNLLWFTKILIPEASQNWNVQVGVIALSDGSIQWSQIYDGGIQAFDTVVGFRSISGTSTAFVGTNGRQQSQGLLCCFCNLLSKMAQRLGIINTTPTQYILIGDARVLTVDHSTTSITDEVVDSSIGPAAEFLSTESIGWMLGFDGRGIMYRYG